MKRQQREKSIPASNKTRVIDAVRLTGVRGGGGLGIAIEVAEPPPPGMQQQHNERLIQL